MPSVPCPALDRDGADRDVEAGRAVRREMADGAAIQAARALLQFADDLHRADLRRAGDRAAGKQRAHDLLDACRRLEPRGDGGDHGVQGGIGLDGEEVFHRDAADQRQAADVVAHQIDDHQVLGAILRRGGERGLGAGVGEFVGAARRGALHRPRRDAALRRYSKEQLGREAEDAAFAIVEIGAVRRLGAVAQPQVKRQRIAGEGEARAEAEIGLIDVAGADIAMDPGEAAFIGGLVPFVTQRAGIGAAGGGEIGAGNRLRRIEHAEPEQRRSIVRPAQRGQMRLQRIAQLIAEPARDMAAGGQRGLDAGQGRRDLVGPAGLNDRLRRPKSQQPLGAGGRVVQDDGRARH